MTAAEFTAGEEESKKEDDEYTPLPTLSGATAAASKIADYWVQTLESHPGFETLITAEDRPALAYLSDIRVTYAVDKLSYTIEFVFDENPYFTNASLKKTWFFKVIPTPISIRAPLLTDRLFSFYGTASSISIFMNVG